jgi:hypothetical protein
VAELLAAIGRIVVNAAMLEYAVAELIAVAEGLRGEAARERAVVIVRKPGNAMRLFERLAEQRPDLRWLMEQTRAMLLQCLALPVSTPRTLPPSPRSPAHR